MLCEHWQAPLAWLDVCNRASGCTVQAQGFRDNYAAFESKGYKVYGISADPPSAQAAWKKEHNFGYPLLCDESQQVRECQAIHMWLNCRRFILALLMQVTCEAAGSEAQRQQL